MIKKIISLILVLIIIISSVLLFTLNEADSENDIGQTSQDYSADDILNEVDGSLLGEDDEVEIGEMI